MSRIFIKKNSIYFLLAFYLMVSLLVVTLTNGTGERGSGDSVLHYLYSKYCIKDFKLFFNHWAKPVFVLTSFPFAQFGIIGIKIFNIIVSLFTLLFTFKVAEILGCKNKIIAPIILLFTPLYFVLIFSGLTEPLFALFTIVSIYFILKKKYVVGLILISFLPFVRSEGLILIGVIVFYLMIKKEWKFIPLLTVGHLFYSIVGFFYFHDFLWVFNKIPYAKLNSTYGGGELFHFVHQLFYVIGAPIYFLLALGIVKVISSYFQNKKNVFSATSILIFGSFISYFIAHSLFWYLGIFNSMGLKRVLIAVAPLIAIISLLGFNFITENNFLKGHLKKGLQATMIIAVIIFPLTGNKAAIDFNKDFSLTEKQLVAKKMTAYIAQNFPNYNHFLFSDPYIAELMEINFLDKNLRLDASQENIQNARPKTIVIWDNWFSVVENGMLIENINFEKTEKIKDFKNKDNEICYSLMVIK